MEKAKQAVAGDMIPITKDAFCAADTTVVRWLGNGGAMLNVRGTVIMIDPLLKGFDMPLLVDVSVKKEDITRLDGILITHSDNDHFSRATCLDLADVCGGFHTTHRVKELFQTEQIGAAKGYDIGEEFTVGNAKIKLTPADHGWQNDSPKYADRFYRQEECCGFWIETPDGSIWMPGDSRLMEEQLTMPQPDVILLDISDSSWHIGLKGVERLTAAYPDAVLIPIHWGCVDAPKMAEFNGDPEFVRSMIVKPDRFHVLAPGEAFVVS